MKNRKQSTISTELTTTKYSSPFVSLDEVVIDLSIWLPVSVESLLLEDDPTEFNWTWSTWFIRSRWVSWFSEDFSVTSSSQCSSESDSSTYLTQAFLLRIVEARPFQKLFRGTRTPYLLKRFSYYSSADSCDNSESNDCCYWSSLNMLCTQPDYEKFFSSL